jgi:hypothetical protein
MQRRAAQTRGMRPLPSVQTVVVPDEYKPPQDATQRGAPVAIAGNAHNQSAIVDQIDAFGARVTELQKRQYRVRGTPIFDVPTYVGVPTTLEELRRGNMSTENKIKAPPTEWEGTGNEEPYEVLLCHPHILGVGGIVFMMHPKCDPKSGGIEERYVPIGLSCNTDLAKNELGAGDEKTFFRNFKVA